MNVVFNCIPERCGEFEFLIFFIIFSIGHCFVNVVVHIFLAETRKFYRLEEMWSDGIAQEEIDEEKPKAASKKDKVEKAPSKPKKSVKKL